MIYREEVRIFLQSPLLRFLFFVLLVLFDVLIRKESLEVALLKGGEKGGAEARGDEVEEGGLSSLEDVHDHDRGDEAERVGDHVIREVGSGEIARLHMRIHHLVVLPL